MRTIPAPDVEETVIDPLTMAEITALLKACDTARTYKMRQDKNVVPVRATAARDRMIIMILFDTGLRAQELCDRSCSCAASPKAHRPSIWPTSWGSIGRTC